MITSRKNEQGGFSVSLPFELKDSFRATFPSAKWDPSRKEWKVGVRSKRRLDAWIAETQSAALALDEKTQVESEAELTEEELRRIRAEVGAVKRSANSVKALREQIAETREMLQQEQAILEKAREEKAREEKALQNERADIEETLNQIIDLASIKNAVNTMALNMVPSDRKRKGLFEDARETIKNARDQLRAAGYSLAAIEILATANVNRPDRDHPSFITDKEWFTLRHYTTDC